MAKKKIELVDPTEYTLEITVSQILARQGVNDSRLSKKSLGFSKAATTEYTESAPEETEKKPDEAEEKVETVKAPVEVRTRRKKRTDETSMPLHRFVQDNGHIEGEFGGPFGYMKKTARAAAKTISLAKYKQPAVELIRFVPQWVDLGPNENIEHEFVLEPRSRGKTMELVAFEKAADRKVQMTMFVSQTCPLTGKELSAILTAIRDYDGFGPSRRGLIKDITVIN